MKYIFKLVPVFFYLITWFSWIFVMWPIINIIIFIYHLDFSHFIKSDEVDFEFVVKLGKKFGYRYDSPIDYILGRYKVVKNVGTKPRVGFTFADDWKDYKTLVFQRKFKKE